MSVIDVKNIGQALLDQGFLNAARNGTTDDHEALQRLIDPHEIPFDERAGYDAGTNPTPPAPPQPGALYFSPGRYKITETLVFPNKTGYHVLGCGMAQRVPFSSPAKGCESVIVWGGETSGTMINYQGQGLVWNGLSLWGCNWPGSSSSCPGAPALVGIRIDRENAGDPLEPGRIWFGSLMIEDCGVAISIPGSAANEVTEIAFGYFWAKGCNHAFRTQISADAMNFSFQYVHAEDCAFVFTIQGAGRLFTQAVRILSDDTTVLAVADTDASMAFFHINGLAIDDGVDGVVLLNNDDDSNGTHHVRFTNAHFICTDTTSPCPPPSSSSGESANCHPVSVLIDRTGAGSPEGKTMLELVGCRGVAALYDNVVIKGAGSSHKSHLIVRESEVGRAEYLIDKGASSHYTYAGFENWTYGCGSQAQMDKGAG